MFRNYVTIALRTLRKQPLYAAINIVGLAVGLACCILMLLYVQDERTFDAFHPDAAHTYRLLEERPTSEGDVRHIGYTMGPLAPALVADLPEVAEAVRLVGRTTTGRFTAQWGDRRAYEGDHLFAEPTFFDVFNFTLLQGDARTALNEPYTVVLTEAAAAYYFGATNPIGETLSIGRFGDFTVTGLLQDPPLNGHLQFSMLFSFATLEAIEGWQRWINDWTSDGFITYIVLREGATAEAVAAGLARLGTRYRAAEAIAARQPYLQPLADVHFGSAQVEFDRNAGKGERAYVFIFMAIALFVLAIACINYMNLATARSLHRAREVGLRKVIGAAPRQLVSQFLSESVLMALLALALAVALVVGVLPAFNAFTGKALGLGGAAGARILLALVALTAVVGVVSGSYPALHLVRFRPAQALKGGTRSGRGPAAVRQGLVVVQFALSIVLIVATVGVARQLDYIQSKQLGFVPEQLVVVDINSSATRRDFQAVKDEYARIAAVERVSVTSRVPGDWKTVPTVQVLPPGQAEDQALQATFMGIDADFLATYQVDLLDGRNFDEALATDSTALLLNEAAARRLGWASGDAVGQALTVVEADFEGQAAAVGLAGQVVGVVRDFHFRSLHEDIGPLVIGFRNNPVQAIDYFTLRIRTTDLPTTVAQLQAVHERFDTETPFELNFLDARLGDAYVNDRRAGTLFGVAASLAILIACFGLFGLAAFLAVQRTKEIGVRKVMGATVGQIVVLLSRDFTRLVGIAFLLAAPVAYLVTNRWLDAFAYHLDLGFGTVVLAGLAALAVAWVTVSYQALKAATADPVASLRYE